MIIIEGKLVSMDLFDKQFVCNLNACKGACCIEGDAGAPVREEERKILKEIFPKVKPYLREEGIHEINQQGTSIWDFDEYTTPLVKGKECAYVVFEGGVALCGIEKAHLEGKIGFKKPISCHLYPIRITKNDRMEALNYQKWNICSPACGHGKDLGVPVFRFLKDPIIREYGESFYQEMEKIFKDLEGKKGDLKP